MLTAEEANREQENPAETVETAQEESVSMEVVMEESEEQIHVVEERTEVESSNPPSTEQVRTKRPIVQPQLSN